jgi:hypothetical protein
MPVKHPTRRKILTKAVLATIPALVDGGLTAYEIAEELGCKITTLRVRCSQEKISLRRPGSRPQRPDLLTIRMSTEALAQLQNRALLFGTTRANVARELLETIVRDKLYDAVLDDLDPSLRPMTIALRGHNR